MAVCLIAVGVVIYRNYQQAYQSNVRVAGPTGEAYCFIPTGADFGDVAQLLYQQNRIINRSSFEWVAEREGYKEQVLPGRYLLKAGMGNLELVHLLRSGVQSPLKVRLRSVRTKNEVIGRLTAQLEADSVELLHLLNDSKVAARYGFDVPTFPTMLLAGTYQFEWNTSAEQVLDSMATSYRSFWNAERQAKARRAGLLQSEVVILASIVRAEQSIRPEEQSKIAGLYMNRLKQGMRLQSDPAVIFGLGDFSITRLLDKQKQLDTPYNTYLHSGLPPGPINLPLRKAIDAVLNFKKHDYIYMCAKSDRSGFHHFSKTYKEHQLYARQFRASLDKRGIYQ